MALDGIAGLLRLGLKHLKPGFIPLADGARAAGQWERAAQLYRKALDRNSRNAPIWVQYGHVLKEAGKLCEPDKLAQAEMAYRRAVSLDPSVADTYLQLGHVLKLQSKAKEAQAAYLRAFALDPSMPYPLQELGGLGWPRAQLSELRAMLDSAVPLPPNDEPSRPRDPTKPPESNGAIQPLNVHSSVIAGSFDSLAGTIAAGWAWNPSDPDKSVEVKFSVGDKIVGNCRTRTSRDDVKAAGYAPGPCGFETDLQLDLAENEAIEVRAWVVETGAELLNSPCIPAEPPHPMGRLMRKQRVTGTFLTRLRSRLDRETDGLVSIVMPAYNTKEEWLCQAIESVRAQWCTRWELLCIDDGSSERHVQNVIKAYAAQDDRIRYFRRETNGGIAKATNVGIFAAEGTYIAFMDHDDYLEPDAIYWLLRTTRTGAKLIYSDEIATGYSINSLLATSATPSFSYDFYLSHPYFVHIVCVERSLARNIGGWDETMKISGDVDFVLRILRHADSVAHVPRILYRWRIHPESTGHVMRPQVTAATLGALNRHLSQVFPGAYATEGVIHNQHKIHFPEGSGKTTIVIRTKNRDDLLRRCIESIWTTTNPDDVQIVVIDHSSDYSATREYVNSITSKVQVIPCFSDSDISMTNNYVISRISARSRYLLFMDGGIEALERGWLERLRSIANRPDVGVVGATLLDSHHRIWHSGVIIGLNGSADRAHKSLPYLEAAANGTRNPGYLASLVSLRDYSAVTAECMMMRWETFDCVGGFNENFAVSYYDIDLCLRIRRLGMKILADPYAVLSYHEDPARFLDQSGDRAFFCDRWNDELKKGDPYYNPLLTLTGIGHTVDNRPAVGGSARVIPVFSPGRGPVPEVVQPCHSPSCRTPDGAAIIHSAHQLHKRRGTFHVVYISGEPETPGHRYRVERPMATAAILGAWTTWMKVSEIPKRLGEIEAADAVILWRVPWDEHVALCVDVARRRNAKIVFDVDDLMVDPTLARLEIIDGIRTHNLPEKVVQEHFSRIRSTMLAADLCVATTDELAAHMRHAWKPTVVLPNTFNHAVLEASRLAVRRRRRLPKDGVVRLGYAGGSRTHQRDFFQCADAVAHVLRENPQCRLVAFRSSDSSVAILDTDEFPALRGLEDRIEWRNYVPLEGLPDEVARFDINLAPLEVGNSFCEAKSELKFFEAALSGVVTIASPTGPFRRAIRNGETGFLASTPTEWRDALQKLVGDPCLRRRISAAALREVLWVFGPEQQTERMSLFFELLRGEREAARAFEIGVLRQPCISRSFPPVPAHELIFENDHLSTAKVTVVVPLYNYEAFVAEALDSVAAQTLQELDLIIVDDCSTDASLGVALGWVKTKANRFNRVLVFKNSTNSGLGLTRNVGFDAAETPFVLPLDPDNRLLPDCAAACLAAVQRTGAAFAYPVIRQFGAEEGLMGTVRYDPMRLSLGNYIDAMAIVAKSVWLTVGGYEHLRTGWEDFDLWCKFGERGFRGVQVPGGPFAEYRVHSNSMTQTVNNRPGPARTIMKRLEERHPWLTLNWPLPYSSREAGEEDTLSNGAPCHGKTQAGSG